VPPASAAIAQPAEVLAVIDEMLLPDGGVANTGVPLVRSPLEENTRAFNETAPA
jgi:hypothetical protein